MFSFLPFLAFLKNVPAKVWLILALVLSYPVTYLYGHHKGYLQGQDDKTQEYVDAAAKAAKEEKAKENKDKEHAAKENADLISKLAQNEISKKQLQEKLNALLNQKTPNIISECPPVDPDTFRVLQQAIDKANK